MAKARRCDSHDYLGRTALRSLSRQHSGYKVPTVSAWKLTYRTLSISTIYLLTTLMSQTTQKDFKVTVIGGGVCGLACAIALQKAGITVDLFEAAVRFPCYFT